MFEITWMAEPVSAFYQHISTAMPQDRPGALKPEEYAAIVAWALRQNGLPAGDREVPADAAALAGYHWK
jgi:alcohol dehydrogenase (cytochrome c)